MSAVEMLLGAWDAPKSRASGLIGGGPLPAAVWHAFHSVVCDADRQQLGTLLLRASELRGLPSTEVPLWALVQLGRAPTNGVGAAAGKSVDSGTTTEVAAVDGPGTAMHAEACSQLGALLSGASSDGLDGSELPIRIFIALRRCRDPAAAASCEQILRSGLGERQFRRRVSSAATTELIAEFRAALKGRRPPDVALAMELLELGARIQTRDSSADISDGEDPWLRDELHNCTPLELLVRNRYADPGTIGAAITRAVELKADPNRGPCGSPVLLAVRARHATAVRALLSCGAQLSHQAVEAVRRVSDRRQREELEDVLMEHFVKQENCGLTLQDVGLWAAVQCGFSKVVSKAITDGASVDAHVFTALRRCRKEDARKTMAGDLAKHLGNRFKTIQAEAASAELVQELCDALRERREPDEEIVAKVLALGADPQARVLDVLDRAESDDGSETSEDDEEIETHSNTSAQSSVLI
mmetsp:Transcript_57011/g.158755  ORF Transcript_57011/g.158755 Transcript_57011/m.158755 type:complete len:471 (+) Transcript_57011:1-1413(+)